MMHFSRLNLVFLSSLLVSTSLYAVSPEDDPGDTTPSVAQRTKAEELPQEQPTKQGWGTWTWSGMRGAGTALVNSGQNVIGRAVSIASTGANAVKRVASAGVAAAQAAHQKVQELDERIRNGIDLYPPLKSTAQYAMEQSDDVPPVAANFIQGFYGTLGPVIENLLINTLRLGGSSLAGELAENLGLTQQILNSIAKNAIPVNPLDSFYVKGISTLLQGINLTDLVGRTTQGISPILKEKAGVYIDSTFDNSGQATQSFLQYLSEKKEESNQEALVPQTNSRMKNIGRHVANVGMEIAKEYNKDLWNDFSDSTIDKTLSSLSEDLSQKYLPENLRPLIKTLLLGADQNIQEQAQVVSTVNEKLAAMKKVNSYFQPKNVASLVVPRALQVAWNESLKGVNRRAGNIVGESVGSVTEDLIRQLRLSNQKLFQDEKLKVSLNSFSMGRQMEQFFGPFLSEAFQYAGQMAAEKVLVNLENHISKKLAEKGIPYDAKELMYSQTQLSKSARVGAMVVRSAVWGSYYGYRGISSLKVLCDWDTWQAFTVALNPQLADEEVETQQ